MVFYAVQYSIDIIESGFCVFSPLLSVGYVVKLLLQTAFFVHEPSCGFLVKGFHCFCGYSINHFSELCVNFGNPHLQVEAVVMVNIESPLRYAENIRFSTLLSFDSIAIMPFL